MKVKALLKFYFSAENLERTLDGLLLKRACRPAADVEATAEYACRLIESKSLLAELWSYLNGIISRMKEEDVRALYSYSVARGGADESVKKAHRRAVMKFRRRAARLQSFSAGIDIVNGYYCVLNAEAMSPCG